MNSHKDLTYSEYTFTLKQKTTHYFWFILLCNVLQKLFLIDFDNILNIGKNFNDMWFLERQYIKALSL